MGLGLAVFQLQIWALCWIVGWVVQRRQTLVCCRSCHHLVWDVLGELFILEGFTLLILWGHFFCVPVFSVLRGGCGDGWGGGIFPGGFGGLGGAHPV